MQLANTCADCREEDVPLQIWKDKAALGCAEELLLCRRCWEMRDPWWREQRLEEEALASVNPDRRK